MKYGYPEKIKKSPFKEKGKNRCPVCGINRLDSEMFPPSPHCERPLCESCYSQHISNNYSQRCVVCGDWLSSEKNKAIEQNPREILNHVCDWECMAQMIYSFNNALTGQSIDFPGKVIEPEVVCSAPLALSEGSGQTFNDFLQGENLVIPKPRRDHQ
jgi:hypothetical protein